MKKLVKDIKIICESREKEIVINSCEPEKVKEMVTNFFNGDYTKNTSDDDELVIHVKNGGPIVITKEIKSGQTKIESFV